MITSNSDWVTTGRPAPRRRSTESAFGISTFIRDSVDIFGPDIWSLSAELQFSNVGVPNHQYGIRIPKCLFSNPKMSVSFSPTPPLSAPIFDCAPPASATRLLGGGNTATLSKNTEGGKEATTGGGGGCAGWPEMAVALTTPEAKSDCDPSISDDRSDQRKGYGRNRIAG